MCCALDSWLRSVINEREVRAMEVMCLSLRLTVKLNSRAPAVYIGANNALHFRQFHSIPVQVQLHLIAETLTILLHNLVPAEKEIEQLVDDPTAKDV